MGITSFDPSLSLQKTKLHTQNNLVIEEIQGLIKVYKNGHIERPPIVPNVICVVPSPFNVTSKDITIDKQTNLWARIYVPNNQFPKIPFLIYFHGGGFCVGSASWKCYHEFLTKLAYRAKCVIMSVNYRLAPEHRLPKAYEDGFNSIMWVKQQALCGTDEHKWWLNRCDLSSTFLIGDSAGANIAYNISFRLSGIKSLSLKGIILIQPFFGGEARTESERNSTQPRQSALTLASSDTYWRLSLPTGANRDHPWCNPIAKGAPNLSNFRFMQVMVCVSEKDILKDRDFEFCDAMARSGVRVEKVVSRGVGHAFQVLDCSETSRTRTEEMMNYLKSFIKR